MARKPWYGSQKLSRTLLFWTSTCLVHRGRKSFTPSALTHVLIRRALSLPQQIPARLMNFKTRQILSC